MDLRQWPEQIYPLQPSAALSSHNTPIGLIPLYIIWWKMESVVLYISKLHSTFTTHTSRGSIYTNVLQILSH